MNDGQISHHDDLHKCLPKEHKNTIHRPKEHNPSSVLIGRHMTFTVIDWHSFHTSVKQQRQNSSTLLSYPRNDGKFNSWSYDNTI